MFRNLCRQYDICIFKRSKLRVERTTKCFARNSWVLGEQRYRAYTQWFASYSNQSVQSSQFKKAPFDGKRTTLALPNDSFCQSIVVVLHGKRSRFRRLMQSFCYRKAVMLGWKRGSGGVKSIKNDSENLQNRFLFCNSFLLSVLYLHWLESTGGTLESGSSESRNVTITLIKSNCRRLWRGRHMPEQAAV